jgi:hypothetical protein
MKKIMMTTMAAAAITLVAGNSQAGGYNDGYRPGFGPKAKAAAQPVPQQQISTGYVTIHTIPEGAMVLVNVDMGSSAYCPIPFSSAYWQYLANGYSPLTVRVPLDNSGLMKYTLIVECTPTGPNQLSQRGHIVLNQQPGDFSVSMYNTVPGANL